MRIYTTKSRRILRVHAAIVPGYTSEYAGTHYVPSISFDAIGDDSVRYTVSLSDSDIQTIVRARAQYERYFISGLTPGGTCQGKE